MTTPGQQSQCCTLSTTLASFGGALVLCWINISRNSFLFSRWTDADLGANAALADLLLGGARPNIDFGFTYGPACALTCLLWGATAGTTTASILFLLGLMHAAQTGIAVYIGRILRLSWLYSTVFAVGLATYSPLEPSLAHIGERIGLLLAVNAAADRRWSSALAACALAVAFRPSIGYVLGLGIVVLICQRHFRRPLEVAKQLCVAFVISSIVAIIYTLLLGSESYLNTVIPWSGMRLYQQQGGSFLQDSMSYFVRGEMNWKGHLGFPRAAEFLALLLLLAALPLVWRCRAENAVVRIYFSCTLVFLCATTFSFGRGLAYAYYSIFVWIGLFSAIAALPKARTILAIGIMGISLNILSATSISAILLWNYGGHAFTVLETSGLIVRNDERDELDEMLAIAQQDRVSYLSYMGDQKIFNTLGFNLTRPRYWCLNLGVPTPEELAAIRREIHAGKYLIVPKSRLNDDVRTTFHREISRSPAVFDGRTYLMRRVSDGDGGHIPTYP